MLNHNPSLSICVCLGSKNINRILYCESEFAHKQRFQSKNISKQELDNQRMYKEPMKGFAFSSFVQVFYLPLIISKNDYSTGVQENKEHCMYYVCVCDGEGDLMVVGYDGDGEVSRCFVGCMNKIRVVFGCSGNGEGRCKGVWWLLIKVAREMV